MDTPKLETERTQAPQIAGILREPIITPYEDGSGMQVSYHWEDGAGNDTFLYIGLTQLAGQNGMIARTNVDSKEVKGQGDALWAFMTDRLQGFSDATQRQILHEVHANDYSRRLPAGDSRYHEVYDGGTYYSLYEPAQVGAAHE